MAVSPNADRFLVGSSVRLFMQVSKPGTRDPADPAVVVLVRLERTHDDQVTDVTPTDIEFEKSRDGLYTYLLAPDSLPEGTYAWVVRAEDGQNGVALAADEFVMLPLP